MRRGTRACIVGAATAAWLASAAGAADEYLQHVKPVLRARCYACHGALKQESGLRLDTAASILKGGDQPVVQPSDPDGSELVARISAADLSVRMPPEGEPLTRAQIDAIRRWIAAGAPRPEGEVADADPREHWAFREPVRPPVPAAAAEQCDNPIDAFLAAEHHRRGLKPLPPAERSLLLRRVSLDLIGLPPTRAELQAFLADDRPDAYERAVDRLLASPHYGERWGRHWMDVWRYSDWFGLGAQLRHSQKHIWHWRDWIIESLNADTGYDRMVLEMLAADEIAPTDLDTLRATGFLARNYYLFNRTTWLDETLEHASKAFLGLTLNCAKCHDHKYDPISQVDYYRMRAIFEPHQIRLDAVPGEIDLERDGIPRAFDAHLDVPTYLHIRGDDRNPDRSRAIGPGVPDLFAASAGTIQPVALPPEAYAPALRPFVLADHLADAQRDIDLARRRLAEAQTRLAQVERQDRGSIQPGELVLHDSFDALNAEVWEPGPGEWKCSDGRLVQSQTGAQRAYQRTRQPHPADFEATLRFRTTGGQMWKSVGIGFDVAGGRDALVYLSAVNGGSKLQLALHDGANYQYPDAARQDREVHLNRDYELRVAVRDRLLNVWVDGQHGLAYRLPERRRDGRIDLVAFDAVVEFDSVEVRRLPADVPLLEPGAAAPQTLAQARAELALAEAALAAAELRPEILRTAAAADRGKLLTPQAVELPQLVSAAASAARRYELAVARRTLAETERKVAAADGTSTGQAAAELQQARQAVEKAQQALAAPGEAYPSLVASLKALEGPDETEASRRAAYPRASTGRRTMLARWIVDRRNPLTARVAVNHIWLRHFGRPLVEPVSDFGRRAPAPPLQDLLDYLAVEFMDQGWSMQRLHRLIVTSRAYQRSTATLVADAATRAADPSNIYYWRRDPVRMESQLVRDSLLHLAGRLDERLYGPSVEPGESATRRSMYFKHSRDDRHPFVSMFDDADIQQCYRRTESIIPQQALALANSRVSLEMSREIAARLAATLSPETASAGTSDEFFRTAFETVLSRAPDADELAVCRESLQDLQDVSSGSTAEKLQRARATLVHALLNHNDFITIR